MSRIVCKFGGTSIADLDRIRATAERIRSLVDGGDRVAVVVSAMADTTDRLVGWAHEISPPRGAREPLRDDREYDVMLASGEQVTVGLLALALQARGIAARSWLAWQLPIRTDGVHSSARIRELVAEGPSACLDRNEIPIVAGFQGVAPDGSVTTLGRGGSDLTAVALASALDAERCDIYTDVDGVHTADPRIVAKARKLDKITYEEMLELASQGANVLQTRSVELAMMQRVRLQVRSSFGDAPGTFVVDEDEILEQEVVSGIAYSRDEAKITLLRVADRPGVAAGVFGPLAEAGVNVDMIVQSASDDGKSTDITFTLGRADLLKAMAVLRHEKNEIGYADALADANVVKVSVIGVGMRSHAGVAARMFETLAQRGINILVISTSEIKVSVLIEEEYTELALRALHSAYGLDAA